MTVLEAIYAENELQSGLRGSQHIVRLLYKA